MKRGAISGNFRNFAQGIVATAMRENIEPRLSPPDELGDILTDVCAVIARIILLAPPERQNEMCGLVLREVNDIVEQVLDVNNIAPH